MTRLLVVLAISLGFFFAALARDQQPAAWAGFVISYSDEASGYSIERARAQLPVRYYAPVYPGDRVYVRSPTGSLSLSMRSGKIVSVDASTSPYEINASAGELPSPFDNWINEIGERLSRSQDRSVALSTRGHDPGRISLAPAGITGSVSTVLSGDRIFAVRWRGGAPPFAVQLQDEMGNYLVNEHNVLPGSERDFSPREFVIASRRIALVPGKFKLIVSARNQVIATQWIYSRAERELRLNWPMTPELEPVTKGLLKSMWLASAAGPELRYEAYLQLRAILLANPDRIDVKRAIAALEMLE